MASKKMTKNTKILPLCTFEIMICDLEYPKDSHWAYHESELGCLHLIEKE